MYSTASAAAVKRDILCGAVFSMPVKITDKTKMEEDL